MTEQEELTRAELADSLLKNPLFVETLDAMEAEIVAAWEMTQMRDTEARERGWSHYIAVRQFRNRLESVVATGKMARLQLEEKKRAGIFPWRKNG